MLKTTSGKYVQVGWYKALNHGAVVDGVHYFYQVNIGFDPLKGTYDVYTNWSPVGPATNSTHGYRVYVDGTLYRCYADDALIASPLKKFDATGYEFSEEINGNIPYNAQYPGKASAHAKFSNLRIFANGVTYYSPSLNFSADPNGRYDASNYSVGVATSTVDYWDSRY